MIRHGTVLLLSIALLWAGSGPVFARSILPPPERGGPPQIHLRSLNVKAAVEDGVAKVIVDQLFVNGAGVPAEGTYIFPLPPGASISSFQMFVDGKAYGAEVLDADKARSVYEGIVRRNRDPALLEYIGRGLLQARVFPVPPGGQRQIRVEYSQVLPREDGLSELTLPLSRDPVPQASVVVDLKQAGPGTIYSPTHQVAISRSADGSARVSYEGRQAQGDFKLYFGRESPDVQVSLLSYKTAGEDGYFLLLATPPSAAQAEVVAKDVILVIDLSGSMAGEKFEQAKGAAAQILGSLQPDDRFAVIGFHSGTIAFADGLSGASERRDAIDWVNGLRVGGATNIDEAMARAQTAAGRDTGRPQVILLITDGEPTAGEINPTAIARAVRARATPSQRIFTFGVGFDVNTVLLDTLGQENRGRSDYVKPGENLEAAVSAFWRKVGQPVLADLKLEWKGLQVEEVYPRPVPDLFLGSQLVLAGRYRRGGTGSLTLSGKVNGQVRTYEFGSLRLTDREVSRDYIPQLWANRKVGYLLSEIRTRGANKELVDEVVALAQRYGIVTPYTSFFVNEPTQTARVPAPTPQQLAPSSPASASARMTDQVKSESAAGPAAVAAAKQVGEMKEATSLSQTSASAQVRSAGSKSFVQRQGVWVDTAYTGGELVHLKVGSDRYLELVRKRPDLVSALAVGTPLILVDGQLNYGIDIPGQEESKAQLVPGAAGPGDGGPDARTSATGDGAQPDANGSQPEAGGHRSPWGMAIGFTAIAGGALLLMWKRRANLPSRAS